VPTPGSSPSTAFWLQSITGVLDYSYGNYKIQPRSDEDIVESFEPFPEDINGDGKVDVTYLLLLLSAWDRVPETERCIITKCIFIIFFA